MSVEVLDQATRQAIDGWIAKFPEGKQQSAVLMALRILQDTYGFLEDKHIQAVADYLSMPKLQVLEVAMFYNMYRHKPVGKYVLKVCVSIACHLCKAGALLTFLQEHLGIALGETTADGLFTLQEAECLAACVDAPVLLVNDKDYYRGLTQEKAVTLIAQLRNSVGDVTE